MMAAFRLHAPSSPPGGDVHHHHFFTEGAGPQGPGGLGGHQGAPGRAHSWWAGAGVALWPGEGRGCCAAGQGASPGCSEAATPLQAEPQQFCWFSGPSSWDRSPRPNFLEGCPGPTPLHPHIPGRGGWPALLPPSLGWGDPRKFHVSVSRWTLSSTEDCGQNCWPILQMGQLSIGSLAQVLWAGW